MLSSTILPKFLFFCQSVALMGQSQEGTIKHAYWPVRYNGQVARLLLAYSGLRWQDIKYTSRETWFEKDKRQLGLSFPNLPYLIDGSYNVTESRAIHLYIITKSGKMDLLGKGPEDCGRVQCIIGNISDLRQLIFPLIMDKDYQSKLGQYTGKITPKLEQLSKFYGTKQYALGYLTLADFFVAEYSFYVQNITPDVYKKYGFLKKVRDAFESLPQIKAYYNSPTAVKGPFVPPIGAIKF